MTAKPAFQLSTKQVRAHRNEQTAVFVPKTLQDYEVRIQGLWDRAEETFLEIGRHLDQAAAKFGEEEVDRLSLPFSKATASKLRSAARFIDSGRVDAALLPKSYATVYEISLMPEPLLQQAVAERVVAPDVSYRRVVSFRRNAAERPRSRQESLLERRERLKAQIKVLQNELRRVEAALKASGDVTGESPELGASDSRQVQSVEDR